MFRQIAAIISTDNALCQEDSLADSFSRVFSQIKDNDFDEYDEAETWNPVAEEFSQNTDDEKIESCLSNWYYDIGKDLKSNQQIKEYIS